jgi:hypothetical protein
MTSREASRHRLRESGSVVGAEMCATVGLRVRGAPSRPGPKTRPPREPKPPGCPWSSCVELPGGSGRSLDRRRGSGRDGRSPCRSGGCTASWCPWCPRCPRRRRCARWSYRSFNATSLSVAVLLRAILAPSATELGSGVTVGVHVAVGVGVALCGRRRDPPRRGGQCSCRDETDEESPQVQSLPSGHSLDLQVTDTAV